MSKVILVCGKLCSGKTTYSENLAAGTGAVVLSVDALMLTVIGPDAGADHDLYAGRAKAYLYDMALKLLRAGVDVVLDWGFWSARERGYAKRFFAERGYAAELHMLHVSEEEWLRRIEKRNRKVLDGDTSAYYVDEGLAAKFALSFQAPDEDEVDLWVES